MRGFPCKGCGANVEFSPGDQTLKCPYCERMNRIPQSEEDVRELSLRDALANAQALETVERSAIQCGGCGAQVVLPEGVTADRCSFCDNPVVQSQTRRLIQPKAVLPFRVTQRDAAAAFDRWIKSRWFAPSDLGARARDDALDGVYIPFWTFDAETESFYSGQRGDYYYVEEVRRVVQDGQPTTKTVRNRRTRWTRVSGVVWRHFDDVLVSGSETLPKGLIGGLTPWDFEALVPYDDRYLAGFRAECYQVDLEQAFIQAKDEMARAIRRACAADISGDEQRVHSVRTQHYRVTFKHLLLPLWISAYRYGAKTYRIVINARTGEVQGHRPYSAIKIALAVAAAVLLVGLLVYLFGG